MQAKNAVKKAFPDNYALDLESIGREADPTASYPLNIFLGDPGIIEGGHNLAALQTPFVFAAEELGLDPAWDTKNMLSSGDILESRGLDKDSLLPVAKICEAVGGDIEGFASYCVANMKCGPDGTAEVDGDNPFYDGLYHAVMSCEHTGIVTLRATMSGSDIERFGSIGQDRSSAGIDCSIGILDPESGAYYSLSGADAARERVFLNAEDVYKVAVESSGDLRPLSADIDGKATFVPSGADAVRSLGDRNPAETAFAEPVAPPKLPSSGLMDTVWHSLRKLDTAFGTVSVLSPNAAAVERSRTDKGATPAVPRRSPRTQRTEAKDKSR
jgi:hypothetical protein